MGLKWLPSVGVSALALAMAPPLGAAPIQAQTTQAKHGAADARFKALYTREWAWRKQQLQVEEDDTGGPIESDLPDVSAVAEAKRLAYWTHVLAELKTIRPSQLSSEPQLNYAVYRAQIVSLVAEQQFREYEKPLNSDTYFWGELAATARQPFKTEADYRNFLRQLNEVPRYFADETANMRAGLARGFTPPKITLVGRDTTIAAVAEAKTPLDTVFYQPFQAMPASIPAAVQAQLRDQAIKVIGDKVIPAHQALLTFMRDDYIPHARDSLAAEALPDGEAYYQSKIVEFATVDLTPAQIHQIGLDEVVSIHAQMLQVMQEVGFKGDLPAFLAFLRTDPQFYAKTPDELLKDTAYIAKEFDGKAGTWFGHLPRSRFTITAVPPEIAPFYTAGRGGAGLYLVNTYDLPSRPLYSLPALTLHESAPGHAFQIPLAAENRTQPDFRRQVYISAYGEGWALYCEKLGLEMGMYRTPYERFGMLSYQMWRAARLVVDTGIHHDGWTREQAQAYLRENTALSNREIQTEVDRYISWPGQALSYYLGERAILQARARAEKALGPKFNIRAFHDTILDLGSAPIPVIDQRIDRFIAEGGKGPYPDEE
ncbi:MAG TPA: DUF885 family protein [Caulobacteraceae bacterium]|jgi:uncharacterized protein (DUF885 family)